ncbi:MAG TPA: SEC-C metal-binding domain-containing protein [Solirubrobacterales bacterium]|nr:SEC-C metal-binding domain-containing protein [Solirubrobacterales bacterium]
MASVAELLSTFETTEDLAEAEAALDRIAAMERPADLELGECYDGLAEVAADSGDLALAVRAERQALEHGCREPDLARQMLGWYLLEAGDREEGEATFAAARAEHPDDPWLLSALGAARRGSGDLEGAVRAFEEALALARAGSDRNMTRRLRAERRECREDLGLPPDEDDLLARRDDPELPDAAAYTVAWFPRDQIEAALERWPSLAGDLRDPDAYCRLIEDRLREVRGATGRVPSLAPLEVDALIEFAAEQGLDPDTGSARSGFAALLDSRGEVVPWPPGRNDPCWCGSGRKYKRCCG